MFTDLIAACLVLLLLAVWVGLSGGLHLDGLADTADAWIGGHADRQRTLEIMKIRMGEGFCGASEAIGFGETRDIDGINVTFHPAGHVLGSAQIAVEKDGLRIVVSAQSADAEALKARLERAKAQGKGGEVWLQATLGGRTEVEIKLPGRYRLDAALRGALKSAPGVIMLEDA